MNPDPIAAGSDNPATTRPTAGMTTKVVKGSMWTLIGQVIPIGLSFFATPIVVRLLGAEGYGVLILVLLIPGYVSFGDFGMNMASTKFGSEAYASGSEDKEGRVVRTSALIALITSIPIAAAIALFSTRLVVLFNVPEGLLGEASTALKLASVVFVLSFLNNIFNTPQLTRLRMDLNILVTSGFRMLGIIATPLVLYLGGGLIGAVLVALAVSFLTLAGHLFVSGRLLHGLFRLSIDRSVVRPMLKFGGSLVVGYIAAALLINLEKFVLARVTSVETLAYYSVATSFAGMITLVSGSMIQSLMPAFSQLQGADKREALSSLYSRGIRLNLIWLLPSAVFFTLVAKPFFTIWLGENFGRESSMPFYIILCGLVFNVLAYFPWVAIIASGRTDIFAKLYWFELLPYIFLVAFLTVRFGAVGTAAAYTLRIVTDAMILFWLTKKVGGVTFHHHSPRAFAGAFLIMLFPFAALLYYGQLNIPIIIITLICTAIYTFIIWKEVLERAEVTWLTGKINHYLRR